MNRPASLFDHLNNLSLYKKRWEDLSESDKKSFSIYMINRFISMDSRYIEVVNELQKYTNSQLSPKEVYNFYKEFIPRRKNFFYYIKGKKSDENKEIRDYIMKYYEVGKREASQYISMLKKEEIINILKKYGLDEKELKTLIKTIK